VDLRRVGHLCIGDFMGVREGKITVVAGPGLDTGDDEPFEPDAGGATLAHACDSRHPGRKKGR
jgi:hypothetical protein